MTSKMRRLRHAGNRSQHTFKDERFDGEINSIIVVQARHEFEVLHLIGNIFSKRFI